jgi:hypothetical protein
MSFTPITDTLGVTFLTREIPSQVVKVLVLGGHGELWKENHTDELMRHGNFPLDIVP